MSTNISTKMMKKENFVFKMWCKIDQKMMKYRLVRVQIL